MNNNLPKLKSLSPLIPAGKEVETAIEFYEKLGFKTTHTEGKPLKMAIVERDEIQIFLVQNDYQHLAEEISLRIRVEGIEQLYEEFLAKGDDIIHPNGKLEAKPWGCKEFVVLDKAGVCITFYDFVK
ncbi:MAG: VOC family protein [Cyanobacteria bacterium P01_A01_bin.68]